MRHRAPSAPKAITMIPSQRDEISGILVEHYVQTKGMDQDSAKQAVAKVIEDCEAGWQRAPLDIFLRLEKKTGYPFSPKKATATQQPASKKPDKKVIYSTIRETLSAAEATWWDDRIKLYVDEFEFNKSSDMALLEQVVVEELIQKRLAIQQLAGSFVDSMASKTQSESTKRLLDMQEKLGITRKQREDSLSHIDGNIASVALTLDEKMLAIEAERKKQEEEETSFQAQKDAEPPVNILPTEEKLLGMIGDLSILPVDGQEIGQIKPIQVHDNS